jgi:hypothetical protein
MRHLLYTVKGSDIIEGVDAWGETSVEAEDLVIDQGCKGEVVEEVGEVFPDVRIAIFSEALIIETVDLGDLAGFVVTTEDCDALRISDFEGNEEGDGFDGVVSSINIIACAQESAFIVVALEEFLTHEEVVGIRVWTTNSKQLHQVMELTVNISADCHRAFLDILSVADRGDCSTRLESLTTGCTFDSSCRTSRAWTRTVRYHTQLTEPVCQCLREIRTFSHNRWTSTSANCLHCMRLSIQPSRVGIEAGSDAGESLAGSAARPTSSILVSMV